MKSPNLGDRSVGYLVFIYLLFLVSVLTHWRTILFNSYVLISLPPSTCERSDSIFDLVFLLLFPLLLSIDGGGQFYNFTKALLICHLICKMVIFTELSYVLTVALTVACYPSIIFSFLLSFVFSGFMHKDSIYLQPCMTQTCVMSSLWYLLRHYA